MVTGLVTAQKATTTKSLFAVPAYRLTVVGEKRVSTALIGAVSRYAAVLVCTDVASVVSESRPRIAPFVGTRAISKRDRCNPWTG